MVSPSERTRSPVQTRCTRPGKMRFCWYGRCWTCVHSPAGMHSFPKRTSLPAHTKHLFSPAKGNRYSQTSQFQPHWHCSSSLTPRKCTCWTATDEPGKPGTVLHVHVGPSARGPGMLPHWVDRLSVGARDGDDVTT